MTFIYIVLGIMVACNIGIAVWVVIKNAESDAKYEAELDKIYGRKK